MDEGVPRHTLVSFCLACILKIGYSRFSPYIKYFSETG